MAGPEHISNSKSSFRTPLIIGIVVVAVLAVCCIGAAVVGYFATDGFKALTSELTRAEPTAVPTKAAPIPASASPTVVSKVIPTATVAPKKPAATETPQPTATVPAVPAAKTAKLGSPEYGVQAFLWWHPETADRDVGLAKAAGLTWIKQQFAWRDIEGAAKGKYDWTHPDLAVFTANSKGVDILARMDNAPDWAAPGCYNPDTKQMGPAKNTQDWVDFLDGVRNALQGSDSCLRDLERAQSFTRMVAVKRPTPVAYAALLKVSYQTIKAVDPNAIIVSAGLTPTTQNDSAERCPTTTYVEKMYAAMSNKSAGYFDLLGVHAPGFKAPPEMSPDDVAKSATYNNNDGARRSHLLLSARRRYSQDHGRQGRFRETDRHSRVWLDDGQYPSGVFVVRR